MVVCIILILAIGYFDIGIASLMLVLFFVLLFGTANPNLNNTETGTGIEGFKTTTSDGDDIDIPEEVEDIDRHFKKISKNLTQSQNNLKKKEEKDKKLDERVKNIKDVVLGTINNIRNSNNDDYKRALLENKQAMLQEEHENNNSHNNKEKQKGRDNFDNTPNKSNGGKSGKSNGKNSKEKFQTVEVRALDPSNEDDTNLLITKEILQDMLNRIEYNYESNKYLRKYIKHRVEEIIDINKLTEDE
jgi:Sec-independent protein translocase protein TatA